MKKNYIFKPHIPDNFGDSDLGRLLIIGDSHYIKHDEKDLANFTKDIIAELGEYRPARFFKEVGKVFNKENYLEIYSKAAFANAIQASMKLPDQKPSSDDYKTVEPAIKAYLEEIKPTKMVVFSKRVWENGLPSDISWGKYVENITDESTKYSSTVWKFTYSTGICYAIGVYHPSYHGFHTDKMKSLLHIFFSRDYNNY